MSAPTPIDELLARLGIRDTGLLRELRAEGLFEFDTPGCELEASQFAHRRSENFSERLREQRIPIMDQITISVPRCVFGGRDAKGIRPEANRQHRLRRRWAALTPSGPPSGGLQFGIAEPLAQNPANSREFRGRGGQPRRSLRSRGLDGGGCRPLRTRRCDRFPDPQGKYREISETRLSWRSQG